VLVQKRWAKLKEDLWDKKHNNWNVSKLPEIYDAVKFDLIHHPRVAPSFMSLYRVATRINNVIIPNEYGWDERSRVRIGSVVCGRLLRKLLIDLSNTMSVEPQVEELPSWKLTTAVQFLRRLRGLPPEPPVSSSPQPSSSAAAAALDSEDAEAEEYCQEAEFVGLDPNLAGALKSPHRRVRTRLYFTSESHIQTLMNVLRYCHCVKGRPGSLGCMDEENCGGDTAASSQGEGGTSDRIVCPEVEKQMKVQPIFDYLTQIVFRLYEDKRQPQNCPERFRVEVLFSPGAARDPSLPARGAGSSELDPLEPLHEPGRPLTYARLQELLSPFSSSAYGRQVSTQFGPCPS